MKKQIRKKKEKKKLPFDLDKINLDDIIKLRGFIHFLYGMV